MCCVEPSGTSTKKVRSIRLKKISLSCRVGRAAGSRPSTGNVRGPAKGRPAIQIPRSALHLQEAEGGSLRVAQDCEAAAWEVLRRHHLSAARLGRLRERLVDVVYVEVDHP